MGKTIIADCGLKGWLVPWLKGVAVFGLVGRDATLGDLAGVKGLGIGRTYDMTEVW